MKKKILMKKEKENIEYQNDIKKKMKKERKKERKEEKRTYLHKWRKSSRKSGGARALHARAHRHAPSCTTRNDALSINYASGKALRFANTQHRAAWASMRAAHFAAHIDTSLRRLRRACFGIKKKKKKLRRCAQASAWRRDGIAYHRCCARTSKNLILYYHAHYHHLLLIITRKICHTHRTHRHAHTRHARASHQYHRRRLSNTAHRRIARKKKNIDISALCGKTPLRAALGTLRHTYLLPPHATSRGR